MIENKGVPLLGGDVSGKWLQETSNLSPKCPNINPLQNTCNGTVFVGKDMNYRIGKFIKDNGFQGAFPWAANYDSIEYNNSLVQFLVKGMNS